MKNIAVALMIIISIGFTVLYFNSNTKSSVKVKK